MPLTRREDNLIAHGGSRQPAAEEQDDEAIVRASGLFDACFYLDQNTDVREAGVDPALHYMTSGHTEGRDPSADFQTTYYRAKYLKGNRDGQPTRSLQHRWPTGRKPHCSWGA